MLAARQNIQERQRVLHQVEFGTPRVECEEGQSILREHAWLPTLREPFFDEPSAEIVHTIGPSQQCQQG